MHSQGSLSTKHRLFVLLSIILGTILWSSGAASLGGRPRLPQGNLPTVKDNTESLQLISLERVDRRFVMRMQNVAKKAITAYANAVCNVPESATDYTIGDYSIQPGMIVEMTTPVQAVSDNCALATDHPSITVLAVVFDDGTTSGEFQWAKGILDDRRGQKVQLKRINKLLRNAQGWPDANRPAAIDRLKDEIASLPVDGGEAPAVRGGLSQAKQRVLYLLEELKQWHQSSLSAQSVDNVPIRAELAGIKSLHDGIDRLISLNEKWISRY